MLQPEASRMQGKSSTVGPTGWAMPPQTPTNASMHNPPAAAPAAGSTAPAAGWSWVAAPPPAQSAAAWHPPSRPQRQQPPGWLGVQHQRASALWARAAGRAALLPARRGRGARRPWGFREADREAQCQPGGCSIARRSCSMAWMKPRRASGPHAPVLLAVQAAACRMERQSGCREPPPLGCQCGGDAPPAPAACYPLHLRQQLLLLPLPLPLPPRLQPLRLPHPQAGPQRAPQL